MLLVLLLHSVTFPPQTNLGVHRIKLATILSLWDSHNVFLTWFYIHFPMQVSVGNSRVMDISTQALSNSVIMEFSLMNEKPCIFKHMGRFYILLETIIKLSTPDTCEPMFTMKMCLWWLRAKVPRRTKNLSLPPFLQNQNFKPGIYANKAYK